MNEGYLAAIAATEDAAEAKEFADSAASAVAAVKGERAGELAQQCAKAVEAKAHKARAQAIYERTPSPAGGEAKASPPPRTISPASLFGKKPPPREWIVHDWIPYDVVTGLYGDGGLGKSLLAQQLQTGTALGTTWIGLPVKQVVSLGVYCEDDENELWRRQEGINASYSVDAGEKIAGVEWMPRLAASCRPSSPVCSRRRRGAGRDLFGGRPGGPLISSTARGAHRLDPLDDDAAIARRTLWVTRKPTTPPRGAGRRQTEGIDP